MKQVTYTIIESFSITMITVAQWLFTKSLQVQTAIYSFFIHVCSKVIQLTLILVDKDRYNHAVITQEQSIAINELSVLFEVDTIKKDVLTRGTWTDEDTMSLMNCEQRLASECNWSNKRIETYFKAVIEEIPGVMYAGSGMEDDDKMDLI